MSCIFLAEWFSLGESNVEYYLPTSRVNYTSAQQLCLHMSSFLASVTSAREDHALRHYLFDG